MQRPSVCKMWTASLETSHLLSCVRRPCVRQVRRECLSPRAVTQHSHCQSNPEKFAWHGLDFLVLVCAPVPSLASTHAQARLEGWKAAQPRAYRDAYMGLSAPAVFAPFVRLELLAWDPLYGQRAGAPSLSQAISLALCNSLLLLKCLQLLAWDPLRAILGKPSLSHTLVGLCRLLPVVCY